jgi:hypothetical protein
MEETSLTNPTHACMINLCARAGPLLFLFFIQNSHGKQSFFCDGYSQAKHLLCIVQWYTHMGIWRTRLVTLADCKKLHQNISILCLSILTKSKQCVFGFYRLSEMQVTSPSKNH